MSHSKEVRNDSLKISIQRQKLLAKNLDIENKLHQPKPWYVL